MLIKKENALLTEIGPNTSMGDLFRHYWMPALLSEEWVELDGTPKTIKVHGDTLLAFSDSRGEVGIVDRRCPHRGADFFWGVTRPVVCGVFNTVGSSMHTTTVWGYPLRLQAADFIKS